MSSTDVTNTTIRTDSEPIEGSVDAMAVIRNGSPVLAMRIRVGIAVVHMIIGVLLLVLIAVNQMYNRHDINLAVLVMTTIDNIIKGYLRTGKASR